MAAGASPTARGSSPRPKDVARGPQGGGVELRPRRYPSRRHAHEPGELLPPAGQVPAGGLAPSPRARHHQKKRRTHHPQVASIVNNLGPSTRRPAAWTPPEPCSAARSSCASGRSARQPRGRLEPRQPGAPLPRRDHFQDAVQLHRRALASASARSAEHPGITVSLTHLASLYTDLGRYAEAERSTGASSPSARGARTGSPRVAAPRCARRALPQTGEIRARRPALTAVARHQGEGARRGQPGLVPTLNGRRSSTSAGRSTRTPSALPARAHHQREDLGRTTPSWREPQQPGRALPQGEQVLRGRVTLQRASPSTRRATARPPRGRRAARELRRAAAPDGTRAGSGAAEARARAIRSNGSGN